MTIVGSTKGTSSAARTRPRPGKVNRESTQVMGNAKTMVSTVDTTACHRVNQATPISERRLTNSANAEPAPPSRPVNRIRISG